MASVPIWPGTTVRLCYVAAPADAYTDTRADTATAYNAAGQVVAVVHLGTAGVHLATLPADGPSGILWGHLWTADDPGDAYGILPW